jgi:NADH-quinone oxidoreductase subunit F
MSDIDLLWSVQQNIDGKTICPLGPAAAWPVASAIRHFRDEFEWHIKNPELSQTQNFGIHTYATPREIPTVEAAN